MNVVLVGQPNCGKSTLFNSVAGYRSMTANFPGATVHYTQSRVYLEGAVAELVDLPGTYSLTACSPAEAASRDYLLSGNADVVVNVIDASQLSRSLELTLQLLDLGLPLVICLNMMDEAHRKGIFINSKLLAEKLGVPVVETIAAEGAGTYALFQQAARLHRGSQPYPGTQLLWHRDVETITKELATQVALEIKDSNHIAPRLMAIKLLEADPSFQSQASEATQALAQELRRHLTESHGRPAEEVIESERHALSMHLFQQVSQVTKPHGDIREKIDALLTHPVLGYLILFSSLAFFFVVVYGIGKLIEPHLLDLFDHGINTLGERLAAFPFWSTILKGVLQGLAGGVAIVLPYLFPFLVGMALLEDVGYLPRVAFLMDNFMHKIGLHGTAIVPAILGYGCNVPAVMATRMLTSRRDRFIAAVIATFTPCSARMIVIFGLVAFYSGPFWALGIYVLNALVIAISGKVLAALMPETTPGMIFEVPAFHMPKLSIVLRKTWLRMKEFIVVAWPMLIAGSILLSVGEYRHWDDAVNRLLGPFMALLGLPAALGTTLIFGILRKELSLLMLFQALGATDATSVLTPAQIMVFTLFVTFYIPCVATIAALLKEIGWRFTAAAIAYSLVTATLIGLLARALFASFHLL